MISCKFDEIIASEYFELHGRPSRKTIVSIHREWLNHRHETSACEMEPILWHVHCYDPPGFILSSSERYDDKMLVDLLRMLRLPFVVRRRRTICIFVDSSQVESIVNKLKSKEISVAVLRREHLPNKSHIPNAVFVATHPRNVGTLPLDNVINCQMFQTVGQYVDRMRLLRRKGESRGLVSGFVSE